MSSDSLLSGECSLLRLRTCDLNQLGWLAPAGMSTVIAPQFPHSRSDCRRTQCDVLHPEGPGKRNLLEPVQTAADSASTLRAAGVTGGTRIASAIPAFISNFGYRARARSKSPAAVSRCAGVNISALCSPR